MSSSFKEIFETYLENEIAEYSSSSLFEPIIYSMQNKGKRVRPVLTLMAADSIANNFEKALPAALAIEIFHNFSLVHDDIMDNALYRRGRLSVHKKWNRNSAILSGDAMLILSYKSLETYKSKTYFKMNKVLTDSALDVCKGQQMDMNFTDKIDINESEYFEMIKLKTAVLIGAALKMGVLAVGADENVCQSFYEFGLNLGILFQLQDDYLDVFGEENIFGKVSGGDIKENKRTLFFIHSIENGSKEDVESLLSLYSFQSKDFDKKKREVINIFKKNKSDVYLRHIIENYNQKILNLIDNLPIKVKKQKQFFGLFKTILNRKL
ncbi:MAG: polyprenyl synthetase family protein [Flavobacteriales bacterium]|nr:MAG: polyprenyl synthetase family protein [Flavobacteriales bacterium TMED96]RZP11608.1 MAG: polyprenyl synthetase family protein [Flavobacteriales bacterium]